MRFRGNTLVAPLIVLLVALAGVAVADARGPAGLDTSYGEGGVATLSVPVLPSPGAGGPYADTYGFAGADDGSAYVLGNLRNCGGRCRNGRYLVRFDGSGHLDGSFAGDGTLELPPGFDYTVLADPAGRALVADLEPDRRAVVIRRFKADGSLDRGFGAAGSVTVSCHRCGERFIGLHGLLSPGGRILLDVNVPESHRQSRVHLFRFRSDGAPDRTFGRAGASSFASDPSLPRAVAVAADGAVLLGGAGCCGPHRIYLERVDADGRVDRRFGRVASRSVRRLSLLGEEPTLAAIVPRPGGGLAALGEARSHRSYYLRLKRDGQPASAFGKRGLVQLPLVVDSAVPGIGGAIFTVAQARPDGDYVAFRILADGRPDPAYGGATGLALPLVGGPARAMTAGWGRVLVTDKGYLGCRQYCPPHPAMARFLE